jgi:hypothetical protein
MLQTMISEKLTGMISPLPAGGQRRPYKSLLLFLTGKNRVFGNLKKFRNHLFRSANSCQHLLAEPLPDFSPEGYYRLLTER